MATLDTIVVGLGSFGSAATRHLARRGRRVLGIDRFRPPHTSGSHHGGTRLIREAYFEHPGYVPLVQRSMGAWRALERESGRALLQTTGAIMTGVPGGVLVTGARRSARLHDLAHEDESPDQLRRRCPALRVPDGFDGLFEPTAGILLAEACVEAHLEAARRDGAELRFDEPVTRWSADGDGVRVETSRGTYEAGTLVLAAGAWTASLAGPLAGRLTVERQTLFWFEADPPGALAPDRFPVFMIEYEPERFFYGFPDMGEGVKVGVHHEGETAPGPDGIRREIDDADADAVRALAARFLDGLVAQPHAGSVCLYTNTPDAHFVLDHLPGQRRVVVGSPCSGHGFKFAPVLGEAAAAMVLGEEPPVDVSLFRIDRF